MSSATPYKYRILVNNNIFSYCDTLNEALMLCRDLKNNYLKNGFRKPFVKIQEYVPSESNVLIYQDVNHGYEYRKHNRLVREKDLNYRYL